MKSPTPEEVLAKRKELGLTQREAAARVHATKQAWTQWEKGVRTMHPAFWDLFLMKAPPHAGPIHT